MDENRLKHSLAVARKMVEIENDIITMENYTIKSLIPLKKYY